MYSKKEIIDILKDDKNSEELFSLADDIRHKNVGDKVHIRGLIEFSNICHNNCLYCGLRCENHNIQRYFMKIDEIEDIVIKAVGDGFKTIVLQSGENNFYTEDEFCNLIKIIKENDVALTLSIGEKSFEEYKKYKKCGADRYLIRIETTNKKLYQKMHPDMKYENRIKCIKNLKKLGYEVGTGCIIGLLGQNIEDIASDLLFFKKIDADMIGIGPFIAHCDTPLRKIANGSLNLTLKVLALSRILCPKANIPATTAFETLSSNGQEMALKAGANVVMLNLTPDKYRKNYEIYPNKYSESNLANFEEKLKKIGRYNSNDYGFREK